jgi:hypothetical protein
MGGTEKENIVHHLHIDHAMQNRVMAVFESSTPPSNSPKPPRWKTSPAAEPA